MSTENFTAVFSDWFLPFSERFFLATPLFIQSSEKNSSSFFPVYIRINHTSNLLFLYFIAWAYAEKKWFFSNFLISRTFSKLTVPINKKIVIMNFAVTVFCKKKFFSHSLARWIRYTIYNQGSAPSEIFKIRFFFNFFSLKQNSRRVTVIHYCIWYQSWD